MTPHTPGPWFTNGQYSSNVYADRAKRRHVAHATDPDDGSHCTEVATANAHLIAAAPDLLAVAHRTAELFGGTDSFLGAAARAAIAKAKGGQL